jgi:hypothetical protein
MAAIDIVDLFNKIVSGLSLKVVSNNLGETSKMYIPRINKPAILSPSQLREIKNIIISSIREKNARKRFGGIRWITYPIV